MRASAVAKLTGATALALVAYAGFAWACGQGGGAAVQGLFVAQAAGWLALALAWSLRNEELNTRGALLFVVGGAGLFRVCGLGTMPGWEDDYFRHLWDGWMTWHTGSPYGVAPLDWFGAVAVPPSMEAVLDVINHPEHATIYGPVAQLWCALAAALAELLGGSVAARLGVYKGGLVAAEAVGLWALWRLGGGRALLFAAWCPLAVTEISFAGHMDAWALAGLALALRAQGRSRPGAACVWLALACATKGYALLFAPFFLWQGGGRGAAVFTATLAAVYLPWVIATVAVGRAVGDVFGLGGVGAMAGGFEFNSSGYAVLAWLLGDVAARWTASGCLLFGLAWIWQRWRRRAAAVGGAMPHTNDADSGHGAALPGAAVVGWWALWSPVFHPWYALLALPFLALRPVGWGMGLLVALPLSYLHGLTLAGPAATGDFRHPGWVRPLEVMIVALGAITERWRGRRRRGIG